MAFLKKGEATTVTAESILPIESIKSDPRILEQFNKVAGELKTIAPKADDFLYFAAVMMHAAEAAMLDEQGAIKKNAEGDLITCSWDKSNGTWKWVCSDNNIRPYKNSNADIFPEEELVKAHRKWVGRPLCIDHKSDSVDHVRGVIVDTYYDYPKKRVIALCALDKVNHPELARNVKTGVAASVSMGTAVGEAICTDCGRVAKVEADFCQHMKNKSCYGEINLDLNPIELSIVVSGADPQAKIKCIVASAKQAIDSYTELKNRLKKGSEDSVVEPEKIKEIEDGLASVMQMVEELKNKTEDVEEQAEETEEYELAEEYENALHGHEEGSEKESSNIKQEIAKLASNINELRENLNNIHNHSEENEMTQKKAYFQGGGGVNEPTPGKPTYEKENYQTTRDSQDKQMVGQMDTGPVDGMHPGPKSSGESEVARKKRLLRAELEERTLKRAEAVEKVRRVLRNKSAYFQGGGGVNEPTPGKPTYEKEDYQANRDKNDKQMTGAPPFPEVGKTDGLYGDDLSTKQKLLRAKLNARFYKAAKADDVKKLDMPNSHWKIFADDKVILTASVNEISRGNSEGLYESVATEDFGRKIMSTIRTKGYNKAHELFKGAQVEMEAPGPGPAPVAEPTEPPPPGEEEPMLDDVVGDPGSDTEGLLERLEEVASELQNLVPDFRDGLAHLEGEPSDELATEKELGDQELPALEASLSPATKSLFDMQSKLKTAIAMGMKETVSNISEHLEELNLAKSILNDESLLKSADSDKVNYLVTNATTDANDTLAEAYKLMEAFVRYAHGTDELEKRAAEEMKLNKKAQQLDPVGFGETPWEEMQRLRREKSMKGDPLEADLGLEDIEPVGTPTLEGSPAEQKAMQEALEYNPLADRDPDGAATGISTGEGGTAGEPVAAPTSESTPTLTQVPGTQPAMVDDGAEVDDNAALTAKTPDGDEVTADTAAELKQFVGSDRHDIFVKEAAKGCCAPKCKKCTKDKKCECKCLFKSKKDKKDKKDKKAAERNLNTKEGRMAYRAELEAKLAAKSKGWSDMLQKAHPKGGETTQLDVKPEGDLAKVETLPETHDAMMDVATAPPRIRKLASDIQKFVEAGQINPNDDFPVLISQGLDPAAVKYWKQFYGQMKDGGSQFAAELVKEHCSKKAEDEKTAYRVKVARAYDLAHEMVRRGLLKGERSAINEQVGDILSWSGDSFDSMQRVVEMQPKSLSKTASSMPQVSGNSILEPGENLPAPKSDDGNLTEALNMVFANKRY